MVLPQEIIDNIIDSIDEDLGEFFQIMGNFSLVSKLWLPRARYRTFFEAEIDASANALGPLPSLLDHPLSTINAFIAMITISSTEKNTEFEDILSRLPKLPNLEYIRLVGCNFDMIAHSSIWSLIAQTTKITTYLEFNKCTSVDNAQFLHILSTFGSVKSLSLWRIKFCNKTPIPHDGKNHPTTVTELFINMAGNEVLPLICTHIATGTIRQLNTYTSKTSEYDGYINGMLATFGRDLEEYELYIDIFSESGKWWLKDYFKFNRD